MKVFISCIENKNQLLRVKKTIDRKCGGNTIWCNNKRFLDSHSEVGYFIDCPIWFAWGNKDSGFSYIGGYQRKEQVISQSHYYYGDDAKIINIAHQPVTQSYLV